MEIDSQIGAITIHKLRDIILDRNLGSDDSLILNCNNFDDIVLEHRRLYNEPIKIPFYLLDVWIKEGKAQFNHPLEVRNDIERLEPEYVPIHTLPSKYDTDGIDTVYRCGYCGNIVKQNGGFYDTEEKNRVITALRKSNGIIKEVKVQGNCCPPGFQQTR